MNLEYKGVFPANPTPVDSSGKINESALRAIFEDNLSHGVGGFWVGGSTGEGPLFNDYQREDIARITGETISGKALSIMHVGAVSTESAILGAKAAKKHGCDAICCVPPFFLGRQEKNVIEHYKKVSDAADGLPFFVYNLPQLTYFETTPTFMENLVSEVENIIGLKHSAPNFGDISAFTKMGLKCFVGNSALPLPALTIGAVGVVDAPPSVAPWLFVDLYNSWLEGNFKKAQDKQNEVQSIVQLVRTFANPAGVTKTILSERTGIDCGLPVEPNLPLSKSEKKFVITEAKKLGLL
ncbi:MAG: hypothetical protein CL714_00970 [Chloroflexi bacterium]|nr:hypothetical protein [Chloroflexota bacterium]|tara:strand:- start:5813 stop:6700 length:888 start_codon:yes stop_codon:yes gene_type:complete